MSRQAPAAVSSIAARRLQSELREWTQSPPEGCCLEHEPESLTCWSIIMTPPDCARIYENEIFR
jgi:ubiquitin-protein ligase